MRATDCSLTNERDWGRGSESVTEGKRVRVNVSEKKGNNNDTHTQYDIEESLSRCTMKVVVLKLKDMIGVVGRLRTKHD